MPADVAGGPGPGSREATHHRTQVESPCDATERGPVSSELEAASEPETGSERSQDKAPGVTDAPALGDGCVETPYFQTGEIQEQRRL